MDANQSNPVAQMMIELPRYQSHKIVHALKIKSILFDSMAAKFINRETDGSAMITPEDDRYMSFRVEAEYVHKHQPKVGGYYVVYDDGYESWSPADAFESGYTLIEG